MDTRQYHADVRRSIKRIQRHPIYQDVAKRNRELVEKYETARRELHVAAAERDALKAKLAEALKKLAEQKAA